MADGHRDLLEFIGAQSVFIVALLHLVLGVRGWLRWIVGGGVLIPRDVRWPIFVISALVLFVGMYVASHRADGRRFYVGGIVVMAGYAGGYFLWHLTGHRPLLLFGRGAGTEHISVAWFLDHLFAGAVEFAAIFFELVAIVILGNLVLSQREQE